MELPLGSPIKEGMDISSADFRKLFPTFREHRLTGYVALDILTDNGLEEGTLLYNDGEIIAADYTYLAKDKTVHGEDALRLVMNACAGTGRFDVCEIGAGEIIGIRERNREDVLKYKPTDEEINALIPEMFVKQALEEKAVGVKAEEVKAMGGVSKEEVLKKYGISRPDERMLDHLLEGLGSGAV